MANSSQYLDGIGTLSYNDNFSIKNIPAIISEWSALVPFVSHLANIGDDHRMVGRLALTGYLEVGLFPKLGYLAAISKLLEAGSDFIDRVDSKSESKYHIWDANWGSVFTRANGSAISIITSYALRKNKKPTMIPEWWPLQEDLRAIQHRLKLCKDRNRPIRPYVAIRIFTLFV